MKEKGKPKNYFRLMPRLALLGALLLAMAVMTTPTGAQQIILSYDTNTSLTFTGDNTVVKTTTIKDGVGFNSFEKFDVYSGKTVGLVQPSSTNGLINLVTGGQPTVIDGGLCGIYYNQLGGNSYILNPAGVTFASGFTNSFPVIGSINELNLYGTTMKSITAITPSVNFINNFWESFLIPSETAVMAILSGTVDKVTYRWVSDSYMEVASADLGPYPQGWENNWAMGTLELAGKTEDPYSMQGWLQIQDNVDSGSRGGPFGEAEALYVDHLILGNGSRLYLDDLHLYYRTLTNNGGEIFGCAQQMVVPLPPAVLLLASGLLRLAGWRLRQK